MKFIQEVICLHDRTSALYDGPFITVHGHNRSVLTRIVNFRWKKFCTPIGREKCQVLSGLTQQRFSWLVEEKARRRENDLSSIKCRSYQWVPLDLLPLMCVTGPSHDVVQFYNVSLFNVFFNSNVQQWYSEIWFLSFVDSNYAISVFLFYVTLKINAYPDTEAKTPAAPPKE